MICVIIVLYLFNPVSQRSYKRLSLIGYFLFRKCNILYECQFGIIPGRNTTQAILSLVNYLINFLVNNEIICGVFLDIAKAFDLIDHDILLEKLRRYGIRGTVLNLKKIIYLSVTNTFHYITF